MKIAVTGASGLIGTALTRSLRADGHHVVPLVRRPLEPGEDAVRWDPEAGTIDGAALEGIDAAVNLAGANIGGKRWSDGYKRVLMESRRGSTDLLTRTLAGLDRPPRVLVSGSAVGIYGDTGGAEVTEGGPHGHDFMTEMVEAWEAAAAPAVDAGIRVPFLRSGIVISPEGGALERMLPLFRFGLGGRLGSGDHYWSWISLDDEVSVIRWLLDHDVAGPVNATTPFPVTNAELTRALGEVLHRPTVLPVPAFGPKLVLGSELADTLLFTSQRVLPGVLTEHGFTFAHPTIEVALRAVLDRPAAA